MKPRWAALGLLWLGLTLPERARAEAMAFWQRARPGAAAERELRAALDREAEGHADEHDLLLLRTAIVDMGRGKLPESAATTVLLVHYRIELGSLGGGLEVSGAGSAGQKSFVLLGHALTAPLGPELRAWAHLDRARLLRAGVEERSVQGGPGAATAELELALDTAIDTDTLARAHFLLGLDRLEASHGEARALERAEEAFLLARRDGAGARLRAASWAGSAWVASARARPEEAASLARTAAAVLAGAPPVAASSLGAFLWLHPAEEAHFRAIWARGHELAQPVDGSPTSDENETEPDADAACSALAELAQPEELAALRPGVEWLKSFCAPRRHK